ncbi:MAG: thiolase family protein [Acidimicrobiia bacterium]
MTGTDVAVVGIGIHPFGRHPGVTGLAMGVAACRAALSDAGLAWSDVDLAVGGSDAAGNADTMVASLGLTGIPFANVRNGCATGGTALLTACDAIRAGRARIALVVGFDKHPRGAFDPDPADWGLDASYGETGLMLTTQFFGMKVRRYLHDHGGSEAVLAAVAAKAYRNGSLNPNAWRREPRTVEEVVASRPVAPPLTQLMFCSPGEGAVALVLAAPGELSRFTAPPVFVAAAVMRTRRYGSFEVFSPSLAVERGPSPSQDAAAAAFEEAGVAPADVSLAQVQDTESGAEVMHMAECGLCADGEQEALILGGATELSGTLPVNTDGGCIANGEPIGASGLRQVYETTLQLRGAAGARQVAGSPRVGFTHVYGAPGVSACTVLTR